MTEIKVKCKECNTEFTITVEEQEWLKSKGLEPFKRCKECRAKRRALKEADGKTKYGGSRG